MTNTKIVSEKLQTIGFFLGNIFLALLFTTFPILVWRKQAICFECGQ